MVPEGSLQAMLICLFFSIVYLLEMLCVLLTSEYIDSDSLDLYTRHTAYSSEA